MNNLQVVIKPIITEKTMNLAGSGKFSFLVDKASSKRDIKKAVEDMFSVNVINIATITVKGKTKRVGKRRTEVVITPAKKAVVSVKKGQKIDIFEIGK